MAAEARAGIPLLMLQRAATAARDNVTVVEQHPQQQHRLDIPKIH